MTKTFPTLMCRPIEGAFHGHSWDDRCQFLAEAVAMAMRVNFPVMFTRMEQVRCTWSRGCIPVAPCDQVMHVCCSL